MSRFPTAVAAAGLIAAVALVPARGQQIHRHGFSGRQTALAKSDANVKAEEQEHDVSTQHFKSQPSSEHLKLACDAGTGDAAFVHYAYDTPPAPVSELLSASVWVKATKPGVELRARVVFPKEPNPKRPDEPLTALVVGEKYERTRSWQKLSLGNVPELLGKHLPVVRAQTGRDVNTTDAYVDRLILNVYTGPGPVDVWVDDLDVGPVRPRPAGPTATPVSRPGPAGGPAAKARDVRAAGGQMTVDGKPFFFRAVRHTGTPLFTLREAGFNTLWMPADATPADVDDAVRENFLLVPTTPLAEPANARRPDGTAPVGVARTADAIADALRKYLATDAVLFWELGGGLTAAQFDQVAVTATVIRQQDPGRPRGADLWDGLKAYTGSGALEVIGTHRWPLFTSLELTAYRDWLEQRKELCGSRVFWTWVQNHLPDWYVSMVAGRPDAETFDGPVGPQPEQVRLLAYLGVAAGARGLGFWSDRFLASTHHGRDRLLGAALLNAELDMLAPVLNTQKATPKPQWLGTSHPYVQARMVHCDKGVVVLPIWMGPGSQYVTDQGAVPAISIQLPLVPEGATPWLLHPAGVRSLRDTTRRVPGGTLMVVPEFDLVAPIVFTDDPQLLVWWQDFARRYGKLAAQWSIDLAAEQYKKVLTVHQTLVGMGVDLPEANALLRTSQYHYREAQKHYAADLFDRAALEGSRATRPLRLLMRDHWRLAAAGLDPVSASPYAVSFWTLPQHWEMTRQVRAGRPGANALPGGTFELPAVPPGGARVEAVPGWSARSESQDRVNVAAAVVPAEKLADVRRPRKPPELPRTPFSPSRPTPTPDEGYAPPHPELGRSVLRLEVRPQQEVTADGKLVPTPPVLENTFLAVDSPSVRLPPGTLVRVSGWVKSAGISGTADGILVYDDAAGEPLGVRLANTADTEPGADPKNPAVWKPFYLYRRVPATGQISVTLALTGVGVAYFDDVRVEPIVPSEVPEGRPMPPDRPPPAPRESVVGRPAPTPAQPVSRPRP